MFSKTTLLACALLVSLSNFAIAQTPVVDKMDPAQLAAMIKQLQDTIAQAQAALDAQAKRAPTPTADQAPAPIAAAPAPRAAASTAPEQDAVDDGGPAVVEVSARNLPKYDPLRLKVVMKFPPNVKTIQQASQYLLETANYKLTLNPANEEDSRIILSRPLLPQDRDGSIKTIEAGLLQISGDDTILVIDREHKMVSFEFMKTK